MKNHIVYGAGYGYTRADFDEIVMIKYAETPNPIYSVQLKNFRFECDEHAYMFYTVYLREVTDCISYDGNLYSFSDMPELSLKIENTKIQEAIEELE